MAVDTRQQRRTGIYTDLGVRAGKIGATLVSRKFNRDQEREADDVGFQYMVAAGFDPTGAVRFAETANRMGASGSGSSLIRTQAWLSEPTASVT
jgi:predicted Zn-dependent protease